MEQYSNSCSATHQLYTWGKIQKNQSPHELFLIYIVPSSFKYSFLFALPSCILRPGMDESGSIFFLFFTLFYWVSQSTGRCLPEETTILVFSRDITKTNLFITLIFCREYFLFLFFFFGNLRFSLFFNLCNPNLTQTNFKFINYKHPNEGINEKLQPVHGEQQSLVLTSVTKEYVTMASTIPLASCKNLTDCNIRSWNTLSLIS